MEKTLFVVMAILLASVIQQGPVPNRHGLGSCGKPGGGFIDLRTVVFSQDRELLLSSSIGRHRLLLVGQKFRFETSDSRDDDGHEFGDVGHLVGEAGGQADLFLTLGSLEGHPVLYWRETYQHRLFRQGLFNISPGALKGMGSVLVPFCEGRGGGYTSH